MAGNAMAQSSLGVEYEKRRADGRGFVQLGANGYKVLDDYTGLCMGTAPRDGGDVYLSMGRDFKGTSLRGSLIGFEYAGTGSAESLSGYGIDFDVEYSKNLPAGMVTTFGFGLRDDTRAGQDASAQIKLGLNWQLGKKGARSANDDCAITRDGNGAPRVDCADHVLHSNGPLMAKDGALVADDVAEAPAVTQITRPRRNLGFGSPFVPVVAKKEEPTGQTRLIIEEIALPRVLILDADGSFMYWETPCSKSSWSFTGPVSVTVPVSISTASTDLAYLGAYAVVDKMHSTANQPYCSGENSVEVTPNTPITLTQLGGGADAFFQDTSFAMASGDGRFDGIGEIMTQYQCALDGTDITAAPLVLGTGTGVIAVPAIAPGKTMRCRVFNGSINTA